VGRRSCFPWRIKVKRCTKCGVTKSLDGFNRDARHRDGRRSECRDCDNTRSRVYHKAYYDANRDRVRTRNKVWIEKNRERYRERHHAYYASVRGVALRLRVLHGYSRADSQALATLLCADETRCAVCGLPVWWMRLRRGLWPKSMRAARFRQRMTVDHIVPGGPSTIENSRPCCAACNSLKGANLRTDVQVLGIVRRWWRNQSGLSLARLYWLNETPGEGGRLYRSECVERQMERLAAMRTVA
jgi:hypothetical protein